MKKIVEPAYPASAEREYLRLLNKYARSYIDLMRIHLKEVLPDLKEVAKREQPRFDENIEAKINRIMSLVQKQLTILYPDFLLRRWAMAMISRTNKHTKKSVNKMINQGLEEETDLIPFMKDGELTPFYQNVADENVGLIRSIPKLKLESFKNMLVNSITLDMPSAFIAKEIEKNFAVSKSRAQLIARDQVGKLNGAMDKYRQQQIGVKRYTWETSKDQRVRDDHKRLQGKTFFWDKPPVINRKTGRRGHPKEDFQCRCWARAVLSDLIDD